ncbi:S8 family serine peptidase [Clostridium sp. A1-XYC3]|uniref:S8 family serine peptidase n=1 Tax=Clostridium tanneri TaxID=3037988 RepID=A0ABU4JTX4_9CLOT|nr:S8 family serine peptidase [Clostridium sp. A1-XYC3]MDW8801600.1 S8 family serine peptidase [Clostridium sp. A1-XYC3]
MFSFKSKLDPNLKVAIDKKYYKNYRVIIHCKNLPESIEKKIKSYKGRVVHFIPIINCICAVLSATAIERVLEFPQVNYISLDTYAVLCGGKPVLPSNGIMFQERYKLTGKNICIGLIDSGVYPHADFLNPRNRIKKFTDVLSECRYPYDDNGHGTAIAGILGGSGYLSKGVNRGVAENSYLYVIKAFNSLGRGYVSDILYSIETLINDREEFNIKVICLPFELLSSDYFIVSLFSKIFDVAASYNVTIVVPAGHNGNDEGSIIGIATLENCITVAGIDTSHIQPKPYKYSSTGPFAKLDKPDLSAAAVNILSTNSNTDYISEKNGLKIYPSSLDTPYINISGTSCSAAYVAGVCALLYENNPDLTPKDLLSLLKVSCNLADMSKWIQGAGILDLNKLLP